MSNLRICRLLCVVGVAILGLLPQAVLAACSLVWSPGNLDLANSGWFSGNVYVGGQDRVSYDTETDAIAIRQVKGVPKQLAEHRPSAPWIKGNTARLSVDLYVSPDFIPNKMSRLGIGLRGGSVAVAKKISGGATVDVQDGWSFRINHDNKFRLYAYAYNLNRTSKFGGGPLLKSSLPQGQWMTIEVGVTLNTPGLEDGSASLSVKDEAGLVHDALTMNNLVWRRSNDWDSFGVILTDMIKLPPSQDQNILYRNFELHVGDAKACS